MENNVPFVAMGIFQFLTIGARIAITVLLLVALIKYIRSDRQQKKCAEVRLTLVQALKAHRTRCNMTQEFVAEQLGVTRQAVSKWESGKSDPSTSNLLAIAKLYDISAAELLKEVE